MRKGYIRLLIFQIFVMFILLLNSFKYNILPGYKMVLFLILVTVLFKIMFGFEKDKHRYIKDILLEFVIFLFSFLILYYLFGILVGFAKPGNYLTFIGLRDFIIPIILTVLLKEYLRYNMVRKSMGNKLMLVITVILFILFDITQAIRTSNLSDNYQILLLFGYTILPSISTNIVLTYVTYNVGYKPNIFYLLVIKLYRYLLPIIPNPSPYIYSIIMLVLPIVLGLRIHKFFNNEKQRTEITLSYKKQKFRGLFIVTIPILIMIYFVSGYFRFHAIAIASGSMVPNIYKGDLVIVDRKINIDDIKVGQVLAIRKNNLIIVHRVIKKVELDGEYILYTKGDNNEFADNFTTSPNEVYGKVDIVLPYIGVPTVWFNEL